MDTHEIECIVQTFVLDRGERTIGVINILGRSITGGVYVEYVPTFLLDPENEGLAVGGPWALAVDLDGTCRLVEGEEILEYDKILAKFRRIPAV